MKLNGRVDTILGSTYWENGKIVSRHTNAMTRELEQVLKDIDKKERGMEVTEWILL